MAPFSKLNVLIADDDAVFAQDLSRSLADVGVLVMGPVPTLLEAMPFAAKADAAVLELILGGKQTFPLADRLQDMNVPIIFYSAHAYVEVPTQYFSIPRFGKPHAVWNHLHPHQIEARATSSRDVNVVLPKLRLFARLLYADNTAADRLAELTLSIALREQQERDRTIPLDDWLIRICLREALQVERHLN